MKFIRTDRQTATDLIAERINHELNKGSVLLLLSGGSNVELGVSVIKNLDPVANATIGLIDERYGPVGHPQSNWQQLLSSGLDTVKVKTLPVLQDNLSAAETARQYELKLQSATAEARAVIGIFGMGTDGHTSGVLPDSPATEHTNDFISYHGPDFERLTTTPAFFKQIDIAFLAVFGNSKLPMLEKLKTSVPVREQPAQALKDSRELIVYNDQID